MRRFHFTACCFDRGSVTGEELLVHFLIYVHRAGQLLEESECSSLNVEQKSGETVAYPAQAQYAGETGDVQGLCAAIWDTVILC